MQTDCLDRAEQTRLQELRLGDSLVDDTLRQVERILASNHFTRVQRKAKEFLIFVVAMRLLGKADTIKEMTIAMAVFHESADFNPLESAKVRVAGIDLRERLTAYNENEGCHDPIEISIPMGTYIPEIRDRRVPIAVSTFENWHPKSDQGYLCTTISDAIAYLLNRDLRIRATRVAALEVGNDQPGFGLRGSLEHKGDLVRVNMSLANLSDGRIVCWQSFEECRDDVLRLSRVIADVLSKALCPGENDPVPVTRRKRST